MTEHHLIARRIAVKPDLGAQHHRPRHIGGVGADEACRRGCRQVVRRRTRVRIDVELQRAFLIEVVHEAVGRIFARVVLLRAVGKFERAGGRNRQRAHPCRIVDHAVELGVAVVDRDRIVRRHLDVAVDRAVAEQVDVHRIRRIDRVDRIAARERHTIGRHTNPHRAAVIGDRRRAGVSGGSVTREQDADGVLVGDACADRLDMEIACILDRAGETVGPQHDTRRDRRTRRRCCDIEFTVIADPAGKRVAGLGVVDDDSRRQRPATRSMGEGRDMHLAARGVLDVEDAAAVDRGEQANRAGKCDACCNIGTRTGFDMEVAGIGEVVDTAIGERLDHASSTRHRHTATRRNIGCSIHRERSSGVIVEVGIHTPG